MPLVKKVSDLYGCWSNEPDYRVRKVSKNLLYVICFDRTGNAETYGARFDKNNKFLHDCKAKAKAKIVGTNIIITENLQVCPGWIAGVYNCLSNVPGTLACDFKVQDRIFAKTERYYYQPHLSSLRNMVRPK
jgi:hypothetical protein